jgi:S-DNA-T family DNA segregation ATPase FtsK/SpoIIIE
VRFIKYIELKAAEYKEDKIKHDEEDRLQEESDSSLNKNLDPESTNDNDPQTAGEERSHRKKNLIANLFKSTIHKEEFDIVKHIEQKEEQELRQKEEVFSNLFDQAENNGTSKSPVDQASAETTNYNADLDETEATVAFPKGDDFKPVIEKAEPKKSKVKVKEAELEQGKKSIDLEILKEVEAVEEKYKIPPIELLKNNPLSGTNRNNTNNLADNAKKLVDTLASFGVGAKVLNVAMGPTVTRYELQPAPGVKVSKIVNLADDIALNLASNGIRIEAPIPGKSAVGIEVPNKDVSSVFLREVIDTKEFQNFPSKVAFGLGKDISGKVIVTDIGRMPHLLIAGATGSGKSVCINTLITSILYKSSPEDVKLLMIDPKVVELSIYNGIPHLLIPVVTDPKKAASALNWAVQEMLERYKLFAAANVRDIKGYNKAILKNEDGLKKLPQIVIIVDELADLMVVAANDVEEAICRLAQMARAAGIHLIIATQRPSVDVITGLIKANIPSRIAFNVSSGIDSRTIIDMNGAEKLLGKGDMLFYPVGLQKPVRIQGAFVSDKEIENIVTYLKDCKKEEYDEKIMKQLDKSTSSSNLPSDDHDPIFEDALALCVDKEKASASMIQRRFRVGYNRAARILDQLYDAGYVGDEEGSKPRKVLLTKIEFEALKARANGEESESDVVDEVKEKDLV